MRAPKTAGWMLRALVWLIGLPVIGRPLAHKLLSDAGLFRIRDTESSEGLRWGSPIPRTNAEMTEGCEPIDLDSIAGPSAFPAGWRPVTAQDYMEAYRAGSTTPCEVAERVIAAQGELEAHATPMALFIAKDADDLRRQAAASTERWAQGSPLSPLDGVPVAVKDEMHQRGYGTTLGTSFLGAEVEPEDATIVGRLRDAGALLIGKANMHEIGLGVTGINVHHGATRNPYDRERSPGGSSSGSAAAVGSGLVPIALGADGGGSIRIPASLCGAVGLKATWGRISERGVPPLCWSVAHVGPIAASVTDCALAYGAIAGHDDLDQATHQQPTPHLQDIENGDLTGVRVGLYRPWFQDAQEDVVAGCERGLAALVEAGAEIVEVEVRDLSMIKTAHMISIIGEIASSQRASDRAHTKRYGVETRLNLSLAASLGAHDYVGAQRERGRLYKQFEELFERVDVIVTPTTGRTAPVIPKNALKTGLSNLPDTDQIMRFAPAANLTGLPAISVPSGYDRAGLPIGLQLMGRAWEEHTLLRLARVVESAVPRRAPSVWVNPLGTSPEHP